jgi:SOS-response transcriptional repressor LexA
MTRKQQQYYEVIRSFIEKKGRSPQFGEIATMMGVRSLCTVHKIVHTLIDQGLFTARVSKQGRIIDFQIVPQKMHSLNSCNRQHPPIWYMTSVCPLCTVLNRVKDERYLTASQGGA